MPQFDIRAEIADLETKSVKELIAHYTALHGRTPRNRGRRHLVRRCALKAQEAATGGLSGKARGALERLIGEIDPVCTDSPEGITTSVARDPKNPPVGTVLTRVWRDQEIRVIVRADGFEHDGEIYRSLTAAANAITGSKWNGRLFFGLTKRKKSGK